ncbi:MAG TPA: hypothetical protein VF173_36315 [Thermoanaerobaculia bacterium]|nr:hypothetical protein [Thermoanaerobaculia bacterium]
MACRRPKPLITPALFSPRPPPDREKRENSQEKDTKDTKDGKDNQNEGDPPDRLRRIPLGCWRLGEGQR